MDNNQDQFQKNVFQVPSSYIDESFEDSPKSTDTVLDNSTADQAFYAIEREEVLRAFNEMTQDLEMSVSGYEVRKQPQVEILSPHPVAVQLMQIGENVEEERNKYHETLMETARFKRLMRRMVGVLFTNGSVETPRPSIESIVEHESRLGAKLFPKDSDVTKIKFFYLKDENGTHKWYHTQESPVRSKSFTNSYTVTDYSIEKSSTFFNPQYGREVNVSVQVDDAEAQNLLIASKNYYQEVTGKVYVKSAAPRLRFTSKKGETTLSQPVQSDSKNDTSLAR